MPISAISNAVSALFHRGAGAQQPSAPQNQSNLSNRVSDSGPSPMRWVGRAALGVVGLGLAGLLMGCGSGTISGTATSESGAGTAGTSATAPPSTGGHTFSPPPSGQALTPVLGRCVTAPGAQAPAIGLNESGDLAINAGPGNNAVRAWDLPGGSWAVSVDGTTVCGFQATSTPGTFQLHDGSTTHSVTRVVLKLGAGDDTFHTGATAADDNKPETLKSITDALVVNGEAGNDTIDGSGIGNTTAWFYANGGTGRDALTGGGYPPEVSEADIASGAPLPFRADVLVTDERVDSPTATPERDTIRYRLEPRTVQDLAPGDSGAELTVDPKDEQPVRIN